MSLQALFSAAAEDKEEQVALTARTALLSEGRLDLEAAARSSATVHPCSLHTQLNLRG